MTWTITGEHLVPARPLWENRREQAVMAMATARPRTSLDDVELASLAVAGDGHAFATLYDRHERRVYGFCLRMLANEDAAADAAQETFMRLLVRLPAMRGRDLNFIAYALTTARHACYDALAARARVQPVADAPEPAGPEPGALELDPERSALLRSTREDVSAANAKLPPRQREVLALRELEQLSYEDIGAAMELNANAVAQLISRARIGLRDLLRGGQLESIATSSPDCARALPLLARMQDAQRAAADELDWLHAHLAGCERCRLSRAAMEEAGVSYRALGPIVVLAWLRRSTIARAAELVHADWSSLVAQPAPHAGEPALDGAGTAGSGEDGVARAGGPPAGVLGAARARRHSHHVRRALVLVAAFAILLALLLTASLHRDGYVPLSPDSALRSARPPVAVVGAPHLGRRRRHSTHPAATGAEPPAATTAAPLPGIATLAAPPHAVAHRAPRAHVPSSTPVSVPVTTPPPATPTSSTPAPPPSTPGSGQAPPPAPTGGSPGGSGGSGGSGTSGSGSGGGGCVLACPGPPPGGGSPPGG
jgi:RNA polymerase sigma-70 factor (ECF subfamily)